MLNTLAAALLAFSTAAAPATAWQGPHFTDPPTDKIVIDVVTVNGSGCPPGTAAVAVSTDNTKFTVTYSDYLAQVGVGAKPTDFRKNCQLSLVVHVPSGFTYAIAQTDYRGYANIKKGANFTEKANYYFQGMSQTIPMSHKFDGPKDDNWQTTDKVGVDQIVYAPCGEERNFNINTELRVDAGTSNTKETTSFATMDSTDTDYSTVYHFHWQTCPPKP
ncbi:DUF4360 domain-containing protein [Amycolatopsis sp. CA-230715]|uniref:DUF4360 domain-containing protein n=1 Tax=Amycolatopsis sp. CA-230715 TaxID=2745196 RepID=UPI001C0189E3|nr:DUF4360 domain-containing protein [Amycolatopsis sp. CA-230715]QWF80116.1 hypothetical protein HUW46_03534 [Amycolatopsis sp. CA-230715]